MKLLTQEIRAILPTLYSTEHITTADKIAVCKFFLGNWTWFVCEAGAGDEADLLFGFVVGFEAEWGYFNVQELESVRGPLGLRVERDLHFKPCSMREAAPEHFGGGATHDR